MTHGRTNEKLVQGKAPRSMGILVPTVGNLSVKFVTIMTYYRTISELPVVATVGYDKGVTPHSFAKETTYFVNMKTQEKGTITILRMYTKT